MNGAVFRSTAVYILTRNRWPFIVLASLYGLLLVQSLLYEMEITMFSASAALLLLAPLFVPGAIFGAGHVVTEDLLNPQGAFPKHFFVFPVTAAQLALPFMLYAAMLAVALWALAILISDNRLLALGTERIWIPFLGLSFVAWQQALSWVPLRHRFSRIAQAVAVFGAYIAIVVCALNGTVSTEVVVALSLVQIPLAYAVGVRGVARTRKGEPAPVFKETAPASMREKTSRRAPLLESPAQAIFWAERRMHRWVGKSALIALLPVLLMVIAVIARLGSGAEADPDALQALGGVTLVLLAVALVIVGMSTGMNLASFRPGTRSEAEAFRIPAFFAALPLRSDDFVWAKFKVGMGNMLWVSAATLLVGFAVAFASGLLDVWTARFAAWRDTYGAVEALVRMVVPLAMLLLFALSNTASLMWVGLRGRGWAVVFSIGILFVAIALMAGFALHRRYPGLLWLPEALWFLAALKICGLAALIVRVRSRHLLKPSRLATILGFWGATVAAIVAFCSMYLPAGAAEPLTALCIGLVLAPVLGAVGAPLAMARNRVG